MKKSEVSLFTMNSLVHYSDFVNTCKNEFASSTNNKKVVTCKECLKKIKDR